MELETDETIKTKDIKTTLVDYASRHSIHLSDCHYTIEHLSTYMKTSFDDNFKLFNEDVSEYFKNKHDIINKHVEFNQVYTILISRDKISDLDLRYSLDLSDDFCHPKIILNPDSHIPYKTLTKQETFDLLIDEIDKIKAENTILIEFFDKTMVKSLKSFIQYLYQDKFTKKIRIPIFDGISPNETRQGRLALLFKEKKENMKQKHQIIEVEKNEIIVRFKKTKFGRNGFNAYGKQIVQDYTTKVEDILIPVDETTIYIEENDDEKLYRSRFKGFVRLTPNLLSIETKVKRKKLSRIDDSLANDEDNNIEVLISQSDTTQDSIGEGVKLASETIHVNGHVGANSTLEALNLKIEGATHSTSKQFAKTAVINRHKGILRCNNAKIKLLEGGEVHATNLEIESSLGGTIYAKHVTIGHVKSNLKVYASHSITIRLVSGEDNLFKIDYKNIPIINSNINFIEEEIEEFQFPLEQAKLHDDRDKIKTLQNNINALKDKIKEIKNSALNAKITIDKPFLGLNIINFTLDNNDELLFKTQNRQYSRFYLESTENEIILNPVNLSIPLKL